MIYNVPAHVPYDGGGHDTLPECGVGMRLVKMDLATYMVFAYLWSTQHTYEHEFCGDMLGAFENGIPVEGAP